MVKIGKRKKKGRPPKPDLDRRVGLGPDPRHREPQVRRSTRRRSITYVEDFYDDSLDEEEEQEEEEDDEEVIVEEEQVDDEEDEDDDDEDERREKKLKLVVKVASSSSKREPTSKSKRVDSLSRNGSNRGRPAGHVSAPESSCSDDNKPFKKRKLDDEDDADEGEDEEEEDEDDNDGDEARTVRTRNQNQKKNSKTTGVPKRLDPVQPQGKPVDSSKGPGRRLPEKQRLEMILDKLQKKDTYGVYAEPVDPEELPDYHDVIEHPMDFGTVRKKLANGAYSTMEQFESDVDLICTNAMHYNAPETVYYKQARTIQELARKKFERLKTEYENPVEELKRDETVKPNTTMKKPIKKSFCKTIHEAVASDSFSGATPATLRDKCTLPNVTQTGGYEKPSVVDGQVDGNSSLTENKPEKTEEQQTGKVFPSKLGRKPSAVDENRRVAHNSTSQLDVRSESMCTIFEGEKVQLVSVGLHADHSYARSLARFAATLGPVAWRVASRKIEQAVPSGIKFGRGWVGEYEPLSTPVLMHENRKEKQSGSSWDAKSRKDDMTLAKSTKDEKTVVGMKVRSEPVARPLQMNENQMQWQQDKISQGKAESGKQNCVERSKVRSEPVARPLQMNENQMQWQQDKTSQGKVESGKQNCAERSKVHQNDKQLGPKISSGMITSCKLQDTAKERHFTNPISEGKPGFFGHSGSKINGNLQQNISSMEDMRSENMVLKQVELHHSVPSSTNHNGIVPKRQLDNHSEMPTSRLMEVVSRNRNLVQSAPYKTSESDGVASGRVPNGRGSSMSINNHVSPLPYAVSSSQQPRAAMYFPQANHRQGLSDPVQMMRMLAEKNNNQQQSINFAANDGAQMTISDPSLRRDDSSAANTTAARAWMTLGAAHLKPIDISGPPKQQIAASSLYNSAREVPHSVSQSCEEPLLSRVHLQSDSNKFPPQMFLPQTTRSGDESRFLNNRQMAFPHLVTTDLSRFQAQSPWQGLVPHAQPNKKHDTLPPDLNISFQPPASPVKQSSGAMIDSQQPDLALQL